ncbi:MAG: sulfotransferase [Rhizobiales bacterium]|nr:sulfotransferase [Hyphomicrobiales bacterium]
MSTSESIGAFDRFRVEPWVDWIGGHVGRRMSLLRRLGDWETRLLARDIEHVEISAPVFVCGLARSGSTILLECLAAHTDTVSHCYRDYPGVLVPVLWDRISARIYADRSTPVERAHGDGIAVTPDSPEAIEEMLWMAFHPHSHDPARGNSIGRGGIAPPFSDFYRDHIRKLLWLRQGSRYLSKNNYNLVRLGGLIELFPDARVIVPVRHPVTHIASLMRQHALFSAAETRHSAALRYMQRVGHYEFGLDRRPLNVGNGGTTQTVQELWREGREVEGWSLYWANLHEFLMERLQEDVALRDATLVVRFEDLCADPEGMLGRIFAHTRLSAEDELIWKVAQRIRAPDYYAMPFDETELRTIRQVTAKAAERLDYRNSSGDRAVA